MKIKNQNDMNPAGGCKFIFKNSFYTTLRNFTKEFLRLKSFIRTRGMGTKGQLQYREVETNSFQQWFLLRTLP